MQTRYTSIHRAAVAAFIALIAFAPFAMAATLAEGLSAYRNNRVAEAERMLAEVAADPAASVADRAEAQRELGRIDWLIRGETDAIEAALARAPEGEERCAAAATALRIYREAGAPATALATAQSAGSQCLPTTAETIHIERARTHLILAAANPGDRARELAAAAAELDTIDAAARGAPAITAARFSLALARRDAAGALSAWRAYFWLTETDSPSAMSPYAGRVSAVFNTGLASNAADGDIIALIAMLIRAGFVQDARQFADETGIAQRAADNPDWRRADAYFTFDAAIRTSTLRANREMAAGGRARWYEDEITAEIGRSMQRANLSGDPRAALAETYGAYGTLGETSNYPSLHAGHLVQDERISVEQYGARGELRFIVIDNMTSNGFESWLWDGWAQAGGWSRDDAIVQVRSAYTDGPLSALRRARPGAIRERFLANIERARASERAALGADGVAELTATASRLELQAIDQIAARTGADDMEFIAEHWRAVIQYSIVLHEGRHALDKASGRRFSDETLEYNAKLSQIALSDDPRLGLANVAGGAGGDTPHGNANRRILQGYRDWMRRHRSEIAGFDAQAPPLAQLPLLTDDQIRAIARALDSNARYLRN